jgi:hypothetical protein
MEHRSFQDRLPSSFSAKNPRLCRGFFALEQEVLQMGPIKKNDADEESWRHWKEWASRRKLWFTTKPATNFRNRGT